MYCKHCGALQDDNAVHCTNCNERLREDTPPSQPNENREYQSAPPIQKNDNTYNAYQTPPPSGYNPPPSSAPLNNWLMPNIIVTVVSLCCCIASVVTGIVGIVFATSVNTKQTQGDNAGAMKASNTAKMMFMISCGLCVLGLIINVILLVTGFLEGFMSGLTGGYGF